MKTIVGTGSSKGIEFNLLEQLAEEKIMVYAVGQKR